MPNLRKPQTFYTLEIYPLYGSTRPAHPCICLFILYGLYVPCMQLIRKNNSVCMVVLRPKRRKFVWLNTLVPLIREFQNQHVKFLNLMMKL